MWLLFFLIQFQLPHQRQMRAVTSSFPTSATNSSTFCLCTPKLGHDPNLQFAIGWVMKKGSMDNSDLFIYCISVKR